MYHIRRNKQFKQTNNIMKTQVMIENEINTIFATKKLYNEFIQLFPFNQIKETKTYYYKIVNMFGEKELRLHKKSLRVTTAKINQK